MSRLSCVSAAAMLRNVLHFHSGTCLFSLLLWPNMCEVKRKQAWDCPDWEDGSRGAWEEFRTAQQKTWRRVFQAEKIAHRSLEKTVFFPPRVTFKLDSAPLPSNLHFDDETVAPLLSCVLGYLQMMLIFYKYRLLLESLPLVVFVFFCSSTPVSSLARENSLMKTSLMLLVL